MVYSNWLSSIQFSNPIYEEIERLVNYSVLYMDKYYGKWDSAIVIQRYIKESIYNPKYKMCQSIMLKHQDVMS